MSEGIIQMWFYTSVGQEKKNQAMYKQESCSKEV